MLGAVSTTLLNIRSMPNASGAIMGQLTEGMVVKGNGPHNHWLQINYQDTFAFVSSHYLQPVNDLARLTGTVNTQRLNVRSQPTITSTLLGVLYQGASIKTLAVLDSWLEIEFNGNTAYVAADYVDLVYVSNGYYGRVNANFLNVRSAPHVNGELCGQLTEGNQVWVEGNQQGWSQIRFNGNRAYAASRYLTQNNQPEQQNSVPLTLPDHQDTPPIPIQEHGQQLARLTPSVILPAIGNSEQKAVASTWNKWGALLESLSLEKKLDVACALAVLCCA